MPALDLNSKRFDQILSDLIEDIQTNKTIVLDVLVSEVTHAFLHYLEHSALSVLHMVDVHYYAVHLLLIKAKYLIGDTEQHNPNELQEDIIEILIEFQRLKKLTDELKKIHIEDARSVARQDKSKNIMQYYKQQPTDILSSMPRDSSEISTCMDTLLQKRSVVKSLPAFDQFSIQTMHDRLMQSVQKHDIQLQVLIHEEGDKRAQLISALLVVLIVASQQMVYTTQQRPFLDIMIHKNRAHNE